MLSRSSLVFVVSWGVLGCSQPKTDAEVAAPPSAVAVPPAAASPSPAAPTPPPTPSAEPVIPAEPAPVPVAVVAAPVAPEGPPRKVVKGEGISITEASDGRVILKTTAKWGEAIDTTYSDCSFYSAAIPVLKEQLVPARAKLLARACVGGTKRPAAKQ